MRRHRADALGADRRSISPTIGVVVLVAITVLLVAGGAVFLFGLAERPTPAPESSIQWDYDESTNEVTVEYVAGDRITDGNTEKLVLVVDGENGDARKTLAAEGGSVYDLETEELAAGERIVVDDATGSDSGDVTLSFELEEDDELRLVWLPPEEERRSETLATDTVPDLTSTTSVLGPLDQTGAVVTQSDGAAGDGGAPVTTGPGSAQALGNTADVDGDSRTELPYVDSSGNLKVNDSDGNVETLVDASAVPSAQKPDTDKTLMATGSWNGSGTAVFYAQAESEGSDKLYRVSPSSGPTEVADMSSDSGIDSVLGPGDIDGDGDDELVYADNSNGIRYVDTDGSISSAMFTSTGSNVGIGNGPLVDFDGDGTDSAIVVDGSNDIRLVNDTAGTFTKPAQSSVSAEKTPATAADVDDDGDFEIVYVDKTSHELQYIDDVATSPTVTTLTDEDGNPIAADTATGVVS